MAKYRSIKPRHPGILKIGHRGASGHAPENTLAAMKKALKLGAGGAECDVHRCKSGQIVVIHDRTLQRTTNGKGPVASHTLAELKKLDAGGGEPIPTLQEAIDEICGRGVLFIEVKAEAALPQVARLVKRNARRFGYTRLPVISFHFEWMARLKAANPGILTGATPPDNSIPAGFLARAEKAGMWSVNPQHTLLTRAFVDDAHARGLKVITWTPNTEKQIERAKSFGVDGIISDFPERI